MNRISVKRIYEDVIRAWGRDPATVSHTTAQKASWADRITDRIREGWEFAFWPELLVVEQRQYRPTWLVDGNYATADEVYYTDGTTEGYYRSLVDGNVAQNPITATAAWALIPDTDFIASIDMAQDDENPIGAIDVQDGVFRTDPRLTEDPEAVDGVHLVGTSIIVPPRIAPAQPWIRYRPPAPEVSLTDWAIGTTYAIGETCYLATTGESYAAIRSNTGKSPDANAEDWAIVEVPMFLRTFLKLAVASDIKTEDAGRDKDAGKAAAELDRLYDVLIESIGEGRTAKFR